MNAILKISKNSFFLLSAELINKIVFYLFSLYLAREYGNTLFGIFNSVFAYVMIFSVLTDFGLNNFLIKELASEKTTIKKEMSTFLSFKNYLIILTIFLLFGINALLGIYKEIGALIPISIYMIFNSYNTFIKSIYRSQEKMQVETKMRFFEGLFLIIFTILFIYLFKNFYLTIYAFPLSALIVLFLFGGSFFSRFLSNRKTNNLDIKNLINKLIYVYRYLYSFGISSFLVILIANLPIIFIKYFLGDIEVSYYAAPMNIVVGVSIIPSMINASIYPHLSKKYANSKEFGKEINYLFLLVLTSCFISILFYLLSEKIIYLLYTSSFEKSVYILKIFSLAIPFYFSSSFLGIIFSSRGKQKQAMNILLLVLPINLFLTIFFMFKNGIIGVAHSFVITNIVMFTLEIIYLFSIRENKNDNSDN